MNDMCSNCIYFDPIDGGACKILCNWEDGHGYCPEKEIACKTCGKPTQFTGTQLCNMCWLVETYIDEYLESEKGRERIREKLRVYDDNIETVSWTEER